MKRIVGTAKYFGQSDMNDRTKFLLLNARKQREVMHSLFNDENLKTFTALAITEPYALRNTENAVLIAPMRHSNWTRVVPSTSREGRWPYRSMIWMHKDQEFRQIKVESPDMAVVLLKLEDKRILLASVYVPVLDQEAFDASLQMLRWLVEETRRQEGTEIEALIMGDFNRHDHL